MRPVKRANSEQRAAHVAGFTLTELLIVIAIIVALVALVLVAMTNVRAAGSRTDSVNSLRQIIGGYNAYITDNRQRLMPGFVHPNSIGTGPNQFDLQARFKDGTALTEPADIGPYVWRLAPYVDHSWQTFFTDYGSRGTLGTLHAEYEDDVFGPGSHDDNLGIASMPAFGLNSIFLGGDTTHGGAAVDYNPLTGSAPPPFGERWAATRLAQVRNPSNIVVFGPTARANPDLGDEANVYEFGGGFPHELGYFELRPPFTDQDSAGNWSDQQWRVSQRYGEVARTSIGSYSPASGYGAGLPITRWGAGYYPVAHLDGSATTVDINDVALDMRRWSPFAVGTEFPGFTPAP